jgi:hypothetical protein
MKHSFVLKQLVSKASKRNVVKLDKGDADEMV